MAGLGIGLLPDFSSPPAARQAENLPPSLVQVLPDWQVQGFFGDRIYALRPWSAQVPRAVQCFVAHLRESFAPGFGGPILTMAGPAGASKPASIISP